MFYGMSYNFHSICGKMFITLLFLNPHISKSRQVRLFFVFTSLLVMPLTTKLQIFITFYGKSDFGQGVALVLNAKEK